MRSLTEAFQTRLAHDAFVIRLAYLCTYATLAATGEALVARPAALWIRSQGLFHPARAWDVRYGPLHGAAAAAVALCTAALASHAATTRKPARPLQVGFLLFVGTCFALRSASGEPQPPPDPAPVLFSALELAADELRRGSTASPIRVVNISSASAMSSACTSSSVRFAGSMVVLQSCSGFISPRPL